MKRTARAMQSASPGFSILEGLVALALAGLVMGGVSMLVAQWMPVWNRGFHNVQNADLAAVALDRIAADFAEARYVTGSSQDNYLFFDGAPGAATFVRPTLDPGEIDRLSTIVAERLGISPDALAQVVAISEDEALRNAALDRELARKLEAEGVA